MSKERLKEIKHFVDLIKYIPRDDRGMGEMDVINVQEDMKWLIERVQELEEDLTKYRNSFEFQLLINNSIKKQNKRYREALEFYAEGKHVAYKLDETDDDLVVDYGETARKALEGEE